MLTIVDRLLVRQCLALLAPTLAAMVVLYLVVDFAERLDILVAHQASVSATVRYFLFKLPLIVAQLLPPAVVTACLLTLGMAARHRELVALHAAGVSALRLASPLLALALCASVVNLAWSETIVPRLSKEFQRVNRSEIRKTGAVAAAGASGFWLRGSRGIYSVESFDPVAKTLRGLVIYPAGGDHDPREVVLVESAHWQNGAWHPSRVWRLAADHQRGVVRQEIPPTEFVLADSLDDFSETRVRAEELSFGELRQRVASLARRGLDARHEVVELALKTAVPLAPLALVWLITPLAACARRDAGLSRLAAIALLGGLGYWTLLGLGKSLGETGLVSPWLAAWLANLTAAAVGVGLTATALRGVR